MVGIIIFEIFASAQPPSWGIVKDEHVKKEEQNHNQNETISTQEIYLKDDVKQNN